MAYNVKVDVSPIYELISSFIVFTTRKWVNNLDVGIEWLEDIGSRLDMDEKQAFAAAAQFPFTDYDVLYALAVERPSHNVDTFLDDLELATIDVLYHSIKSYIPDLTNDEIQRIRHSYIPLLRKWNNLYFADVAPQYKPLLEEDAAEKATLLHKMDPEALVEYASGGIVLEPDLPIEEVVLVPSIHFRPINTYSFYSRVLLIQYPIDIPEQDEDEPPICLLRLTRALANPERLRLLRYVAIEPKSLLEMMNSLNESEDKLMHHLMRLRVAGLLRVHLVDIDTEKFSIRPDGVAELHMFLESYIRL
ncbi:ArsR/SmtB family transcription factor [Paenibacillus lentus]|uniref:ArsR family transcriptional regulator n=1 Tax=Paenibacillus lentus TaxID=1338368 RepID=A0A3S8RW79_9BACL|nr:helix-turn-helix domain-containing protein [Paenibacillus lentus]AZK47405.1 ArsR family transcriptional regulator [Paenibacillus lentus]